MTPGYALVSLGLSAGVVGVAVWGFGVPLAFGVFVLLLTAWSLWSTRYRIVGDEFEVQVGIAFRTVSGPLRGARDFERRDRIGLRDHLNGIGGRRAYARAFSDAVLFTDGDGRRWILTPTEEFASALERDVAG